MLTIYFSATGNSAYIARKFSEAMGGKCLSIEDKAGFAAEIAGAAAIAFCYPVYGSRVPLAMRMFAAEHMQALKGKQLVIFATQLIFSGDGARVFTDLFPKNHVQVIYAEHFLMPNNVCNLAILRQTGAKRTQKFLRRAERKIQRVRDDIQSGRAKLRGFSAVSRVLGSLQGKAWQGDSRQVRPGKNTMEHKAMRAVKIHPQCNACGLCAQACPMKNLGQNQGKITHNSNCCVCYRCVNLCPRQAITVLFHKRPKWQYKGLP